MADVGPESQGVETVKINLRLSETLLEQVDREWQRRGFSSRSEYIRYVLHDAVLPKKGVSIKSRGVGCRGVLHSAAQVPDLHSGARGPFNGSASLTTCSPAGTFIYYLEINM